MKTLPQLRQKLEQSKGKQIQIEQNIKDLQSELKEKKRSLHRHEEAKEIIRAVGQKTQEQLQFHISDITSIALEAVFDDPYELKVDFVQRRNKTECDLFFVRDGNGIKPTESAGVGAVDVACFALRIASLSMMLPKSNNTIILDEPFKHLRGEAENERVLQMMQTISRMMNMQIIMVGDIKVPKETMMEYADRVFECSIKNRISKIIQL